MKDMQARLEKLRADAAECALIRDLATAKKRELFTRLADHLRFWHQEARLMKARAGRPFDGPIEVDDRELVTLRRVHRCIASEHSRETKLGCRWSRPGGARAYWQRPGLPRSRAGLWLWTCVLTLPGPPFGDAGSRDEAKGRFKLAWESFKAKHRPEEVAKAFAEMNRANRPDRYVRSLG